MKNEKRPSGSLCGLNSTMRRIVGQCGGGDKIKKISIPLIIRPVAPASKCQWRWALTLLQAFFWRGASRTCTCYMLAGTAYRRWRGRRRTMSLWINNYFFFIHPLLRPYNISLTSRCNGLPREPCVTNVWKGDTRQRWGWWRLWQCCGRVKG